MRTVVKPLCLEQLENRCLLSAIWQGTDTDGDKVTIKLSGQGGLQVETVDEGLGLRIETIRLMDTGPSDKLTIKASQKGGDGQVTIDEIDGAGQSLKSLNLDGYLGHLTLDSLANLSATGSAKPDEGQANWQINSDVKQLKIIDDLEGVIVDVKGTLKKAIIGGNMSDATIQVDQQLRQCLVDGWNTCVLE